MGDLESGLATLRTVPWEPGVAHVIADVFNPDGTPAEESPRTVLRRVVERWARRDAGGDEPVEQVTLQFGRTGEPLVIEESGRIVSIAAGSCYLGNRMLIVSGA